MAVKLHEISVIFLDKSGILLGTQFGLNDTKTSIMYVYIHHILKSSLNNLVKTHSNLYFNRVGTKKMRFVSIHFHIGTILGTLRYSV